MRKELATLNDARQVEHLKKMEAELGRSMPYLKAAVGQSAKTLVQLADVDEKELKLDAVEEALAKYIALVDEMERYLEENSEEAKAYRPTLLQAAADYRKELKSFVRRNREHTKWSKDQIASIRRGDGNTVEGHVAAVIKKYNGWVDANNMPLLPAVIR